MSARSKPLLAITMGDPAGTGPEVIAKAIASPKVQEAAQVVCVGYAPLMERAAAIVGATYRVRRINQIEQASDEPGVLDVLHLENLDLDQLQPGEIQASAGNAAFEYITRSIDLAKANAVDGVVTSAIHKEALQLAGHKYDGHTEIFAVQTGSKNVTMMLASGDFRVTHVSTHCSLKQAIERVRPERITNVIRLTNASLKQLGIAKPYIGIAGLNPHSGEHGLFGSEETDYIQPAIDQALAEGINVSAHPEPPDTVFIRMLQRKAFDAVVAQYHDQGHIAAKIVDFWGGVNITLGLPIIRTSVDHGTAFDIVGTGKANPDSMINAIIYAQQLAQHRIAPASAGTQ